MTRIFSVFSLKDIKKLKIIIDEKDFIRRMHNCTIAQLLNEKDIIVIFYFGCCGGRGGAECAGDCYCAGDADGDGGGAAADV